MIRKRKFELSMATTTHGFYYFKGWRKGRFRAIFNFSKQGKARSNKYGAYS